jgi:hypothetical protein
MAGVELHLGAEAITGEVSNLIVIPGEQREALRGKGTQGTGLRRPVLWVPFPSRCALGRE